jgi:hypothetical protein
LALNVAIFIVLKRFRSSKSGQIDILLQSCHVCVIRIYSTNAHSCNHYWGLGNNFRQGQGDILSGVESSNSDVTAMDRPKKDWLKVFGTILLAAGIAVWIVYAVLHFAMGLDVSGRQFLPYHLAGVIPGAVLRRHRFFRNILGRLYP